MKQILQWPVLWYLRFWARLALRLHKPFIIGIAGSVGKSSTRNAIAAILKDHFSSAVVGNSETGIPLGILGIVPDGYGIGNWLQMLLRVPLGLTYLAEKKYLIAEMGIDDPFPPKNMEYLLTILKPQIAIELNIAPPHTGQFEKTLVGHQVENKLSFILDRMAEEDTKIITQSQCRIGIYNADDKRVARLVGEWGKGLTFPLLYSFGSDQENSISFGAYAVTTEESNFSFYIRQTEKTIEITIHFPGYFLPKEYQEVFAAAILVGQEVGLSLEQITESLEKNYRLPAGRGSVFLGIHNTTIIDSSYNAAPTSVIAFLHMLKLLKEKTKREIVFVFGDMRELGKEAKGEHERVAAEIARVVDYLYCVGSLTREYVIQEVEHHTKDLKEIRWFKNAKYAGEYLKDHVPENAIVLVKGSQNTIFLEEAVKYILANKRDEKKLCRQEEYWMEIKRKQGIT